MYKRIITGDGTCPDGCIVTTITDARGDRHMFPITRKAALEWHNTISGPDEEPNPYFCGEGLFVIGTDVFEPVHRGDVVCTNG